MKSIYEKKCDGDHLTNEEVIEGYARFRRAEKAMHGLGPCFVVTAKEISKTCVDLRDIARARGLEIEE